jgi:tetratricopeptide (TPR) repeat protein
MSMLIFKAVSQLLWPDKDREVPVFHVKFVGVDELHAAFLNESRTRGRCLVPRTGNPGAWFSLGENHAKHCLFALHQLGNCFNRRLVVFTCISLSALLFPLRPLRAYAQDTDAEALRHFHAAHQAQDAGDLDTAAREYLEVTRLLPDVAEGYASLGMVYNAQGKFAESARALVRAEKLKPGLPGVSLYLGIDYEKQHQAAAAVPHLIAAVHLDPANKETQTWLGTALWDEGRTQEALEQLRKTTLLFPSDPALLLDSGEAYRKAAELGIQRVLAGAAGTPLLHQVYGNIYEDERTWESALAHYYRALEQDPHWHGAHYGLGEIAFHRGKLDVAAQEYHHELEVNPSSAASMARLGEIAMLQGKADDAIPLFSAAIKIDGYQAASALRLPRPYPPTSEDLNEDAQAQLRSCLSALESAPPSPSVNLALALANARLGNNNAFLSAWRSFTKDTPGHAASNAHDRGLDNFYRQDFVAASTDLTAWLKLHPNDLQADYLLARTYSNLSLSTLEQLLATAPDSYAAHELLAETYQNAEQDAKALAEYRMVENLAPNLTGVHFSIGHLLLKMGQQDQAQEEFAAELRSNPDHGGANAELGTILLNQQDAAKAIPHLEKALQSEPDQWSIYRDLGKAYYMEKDFSKAEAALQQAVRHDPEGQAHFQLALVYRSLGRKGAANEQFEIARKLKLEGLVHSETQMNTLESIHQ